MAGTVSDLGNGVSTTSNTTVATGATITAAVGDMLVVAVAASNDGAAGISSLSNVVDSDGLNVYDLRALINYNPAAAGAGATLGLYTCNVKFALSSDTITANFSGNTDQKAIQVYKIVPGAGESVIFVDADTVGQTGSSTTHAANAMTVANGDIIFSAAAIETDDAVTGDADTTNGNWSSVLTRLADAGVDAVTISCVSQFKTVNATGAQNWACTTVSARDSARGSIIARSYVPSNPSPRGPVPVQQFSPVMAQ